jgi:hypothetical protein
MADDFTLKALRILSEEVSQLRERKLIVNSNLKPFIHSGNLFFEMDDGTFADLGKVVGEGKDGVFVSNAVVRGKNLILEMSDGNEINCGKVVGDDGNPGRAGMDFPIQEFNSMKEQLEVRTGENKVLREELNETKITTEELSKQVAALRRELTSKVNQFRGSGGGGFAGGNLEHYLGHKSIPLKVEQNGALRVPTVYGDTFYVTLDKDATLTFTNWPSITVAQRVVLYVYQDSSGHRTITWDSHVKWPNGLAPTLSTDPKAIDVLVFETHDSGKTIIGNVVGKNYI